MIGKFKSSELDFEGEQSQMFDSKCKGVEIKAEIKPN